MFRVLLDATFFTLAMSVRINIKAQTDQAMRTDDAIIDSSGAPSLRYDADVTMSGCTCKSQCGATLMESTCDWCYTEGNCSAGWWDYCFYPPMLEFEKQEHAKKTEQLWAAITAKDVISQSTQISAGLLGKLGTFSLMLTESMRTPFDNLKDVMPAGRQKVIHAQGVHCKIKFDVKENSPYTGIFAPGEKVGFIRMGSAKAMGNATGNMLPGLGFKFPRSGVPSGNFVALSTSDKPNNFFESEFSNHVAPPDVTVLRNKFAQGSGCINMVGLSDLAEWGQNGDHVEVPGFPYEILLKPKATMPDTTGNTGDNLDALLLEQLSFKAGQPLFDVLAHATPKNKNAGIEPTLLGSMSSASDCVRSLFGDQQLFIRHTRMEEDFKWREEWLQDIDMAKDCFYEKSTKASNWMCKAKD
mmetsp:Transcript_80958/g.127475  ORF Transcript_80958/g.127475 Transcript_80958/m.127475 type:complete len:413 (+) Transcript_80958:111-1349(+)